MSASDHRSSKGPNGQTHPDPERPTSPLTRAIYDTRINLRRTWEAVKDDGNLSGVRFADLCYHVMQVQNHLTSVQALVDKFEEDNNAKTD